MARRRHNDQAGGTSGDRLEVATGRASAGDKREAGFVKKGGRLVPGPRTPKQMRAAFARYKRRSARRRKR